MIQSFAPVVNNQTKVLILGSMPGVASLQAQGYYAHPRNAFWPIMAAGLNLPPNAPYAERLQHLLHAGIGLWDVLAQCERQGSLDAAIKTNSVAYNPIAELLAQTPSIQRLFCNGKTAHLYLKRYMKHLGPEAPQVAVHVLPSTSPAHAALSLAQKQQAWQAVFKESLNCVLQK